MSPRCPACIAQSVFADSYRRDPPSSGEQPDFAFAWCMGAAHAAHTAKLIAMGRPATSDFCAEHELAMTELLDDIDGADAREAARSGDLQ